MTEPVVDAAGPSPAPTPPVSAGRLIRQMREARGIHLGVVAATLKVPVRKLEALEADRLQEFGNMSLTRALAQSVCRVLKVDPGPVLAAMPPAEGWRSTEAIEGTAQSPSNAETPRLADPEPTAQRSRALWVLAALLVLGAAASWWAARQPTTAASSTAPRDVSGSAGQSAAPAEPAAPAPTGSAATPAAQLLPVPAPAGPSDATPAGATSSRGPVASAGPAANSGPNKDDTPAADRASVAMLTMSAPSWVEATDAEQRVVLSRVVAAGDTVGLKGRPPWRLVIGNAAATEVRLRGQRIDLTPHTRENVARLELN